ncbi:MAG: Tfp pilus assembly protein FimT/FimU [Pyrinomonadaceae bacterium]
MSKKSNTLELLRLAPHASRERGYALVALLAVMTVLMISMMAAAPSLRQQSRRDRELEAIARGEEVAEAIRNFMHLAKRPPTSMDELLEGAPVGTKKIQVLRESASHDPLSKSGEWKTIKINDPAIVTFIRDLTKYTDGKPPNPTTDRDPTMTSLAGQLPRVTNILDIDSGGGGGHSDGDDDSSNSNGPFIGVASRSQRDSIVTYYGVDHHDGWVFTPFYR